MADNYPPFVKAVEQTDPELYKAITRIFDIALTPGELDAKTKVLIALSLDAFSGSIPGVKNLTETAKNMGITEGQIAEALRIAYQVSGMRVLASYPVAFSFILKE